MASVAGPIRWAHVNVGGRTRLGVPQPTAAAAGEQQPEYGHLHEAADRALPGFSATLQAAFDQLSERAASLPVREAIARQQQGQVEGLFDLHRWEQALAEALTPYYQQAAADAHHASAQQLTAHHLPRQPRLPRVASEGPHQYSTVQIDLDGAVAVAMRALGGRIPADQLTGEGLEREPHVTVLYGLDTGEPQTVRAVTEGVGPFRIHFGRTTIFRGAEHDVLIVPVTSAALDGLNARLAKALPNHNGFSYQAHATVAYLRPGLGERWTGQSDLDGQGYDVERLTFGSKTGGRYTIPLRDGPPAAAADPSIRTTAEPLGYDIGPIDWPYPNDAAGFLRALAGPGASVATQREAVQAFMRQPLASHMPKALIVELRGTGFLIAGQGANRAEAEAAQVPWITNRAADLVRQIGSDTRDSLRAIIQRGSLGQLTVDGMAREIRQIVGLTSTQAGYVANYRQQRLQDGVRPDAADRLTAEYARRWTTYRAQTIARTETIAASTHGAQQSWSDAVDDGLLDDDEWEQAWLVTPDDRTCDECADMQDARADIDEPFTSDDYGEVDGPPLHPRCLPGDALVLAEAVAAHSERWYDGDMVVIRTAAGHQLTCTPNHPVLTDDGWLAAGRLDVGGHVISSGVREWNAAVVGDGQNRPARIEDMAEAFGRARQVATVPVPVAAPDFHGDGGGSQVAVIRTDLELGDRWNTAGSERIPQPALSGAVVPVWASGTGDRVGHYLGEPDRTAAGCLVCGRDLGRAGIPIHLGPLQPFGRRLIAEGDAGAAQGPLYSAATDPVPSREAIDRLAGRITRDQIVEIRREPFSGHVYNLETTSGWYIANGIVTHNCRCAIGLKRKGKEYPKPPTLPERNPEQHPVEYPNGLQPRIPKNAYSEAILQAVGPQRFGELYQFGAEDEPRDERGRWTDGGGGADDEGEHGGASLSGWQSELQSGAPTKADLGDTHRRLDSQLAAKVNEILSQRAEGENPAHAVTRAGNAITAEVDRAIGAKQLRLEQKIGTQERAMSKAADKGDEQGFTKAQAARAELVRQRVEYNAAIDDRRAELIRQAVGQVRPMADGRSLLTLTTGRELGQHMAQAAGNFPRALIDETNTIGERLGTGPSLAVSYDFKGSGVIAEGSHYDPAEHELKLGDYSERVATHMLATVAERANPQLGRMSWAFMVDRVGQEPEQSLRTLTGQGYGEHETAKPDSFAHPAVGSQQSNQVFAMGMEGVMHGAYNLHDTDRGHFDFTVGLLALAPAGGAKIAKTHDSFDARAITALPTTGPVGPRGPNASAAPRINEYGAARIRAQRSAAEIEAAIAYEARRLWLATEGV